nr:alpha/beta hydrolase [Oceanococcus sp. HetDA_MAG_MS8]
MKSLGALVVVALLGMAALVWSFPDATAERLIALERSRNGLELKQLQVGERNWPYLEGGPANAPVIVMVHGFSADKDNWVRFAGHFVDDYRVIAPDLPGFGDQKRIPDHDYRLGAQVARLHAFARALNLESFHLVGNSMGGHITALYSLAYPEQVLSAGLFNNAGIDSPQPSDMEQRLAQGENPLLTQSVADFDRILAYTTQVQPFVPWPVKPYVANKALEAREFNAYIFEQYKSDRSDGLEPVFAQIQPPVFILWGRQDRVLDVSAVEVMTELRPESRSVILDDTGHLPMIERPAQTAQFYQGFLDSLSAAEQAGL